MIISTLSLAEGHRAVHGHRFKEMVVGAVCTKTSFRGSDVVGYHTYFLSHMQDYDVLVGPEYAYYPVKPFQGNGYPYTFPSTLNKKSRDAYLEDLLQASRERNGLYIPGTFVYRDGHMHNRVYAISRGEVVFSREKWDTSNLTFEYDGHKVGIEICSESGLLYNEGVRNLDLLFMISSGISCIDTRSLGSGYGVLVDGSTVKSQIHHITA